MRAKAKMGARGEVMKKRTKELEIGKGDVYAMPFRGATVAMEAVPRRGVYREGEKEKGGENEEICPSRSYEAV